MLKTGSISRIVQALVLLSSVTLLASSSHAAGTYEQRHACRADAMRLCRQFVPNVERITACMEQNKAKLSRPCRAQFR